MLKEVKRHTFDKNSKVKRQLIEGAIKKIDFTPEVKTKDLNPNFWEKDGTLKKEIRVHLLKVAKEFYQFLDINVKLADIIFTGSMANHNWTKYSDIDLHLVFDFSKVDKNKKVVREIMGMKKIIWSLKQDIKIKKYDIELYAQDIEEKHNSTGVYSVKYDKWIKKPSKQHVQVDSQLVKDKAKDIADKIDYLIKLKDDNKKIKSIDSLKEKIKKMRQTGLNKEGEYSTENLAFKVLRNSGYIDKLYDEKTEVINNILSLNENYKTIDEESVSKKQQKFFGIVRALQTGEIKPSKASKQAIEAAKTMSKKDVMDFAKTSHEDLEEDIIPGGKADNMNSNDFDSKQLAMGIKHELEHTDNEDIAKEIAMDHLSEDPNYYTHINKMEKRLKEKTNGYSYLQIPFVIPTWKNKILEKINKEDLYIKNNKFGLEEEPHVTVLYGLHDNEVDFEDIREEVDNFINEPIKAKITGVSVFSCEKFDVVKFDIESGQINKLNAILRSKFPYTNEFEVFHAHMTIAYVKSGMGKKYASKLNKSIHVESEELIYSRPNGEDIHWLITNKEFNRHIKFNKKEGIENKLTVMSRDISPERIFYIQDFIQFVCDNIYMQQPIHVFLRNGRDEYIKTTASYVPSENTNHINCKGRSLVDICRSIAHELTHNRQREIQKITPEKNIPNIGGEIENEADSVAGMLIKRYTHDNGHDAIYDL